MQNKLMALVLAAAVTPSFAQADELITLSNTLCEKVKSCALAEMKTEKLDDATRAMIKPMLDNMCVSMGEYTAAVAENDELRGSAVACLKSLQSVTCDDLKRGEQGTTSACKEFRDKSKAAG